MGEKNTWNDHLSITSSLKIQPNASNIPVSLFADVIGSISFQRKLLVHFSNLNGKDSKQQNLDCTFQ